jgi:hypothetical protein
LDLIPGQFERAFATDSLLGIGGERREAIDLLEDAQVDSSAFDVLEAIEGLVRITCSTALLVVGTMRLSTALRRGAQWRSRKSKMADASGV